MEAGGESSICRRTRTDTLINGMERLASLNCLDLTQYQGDFDVGDDHGTCGVKHAAVEERRGGACSFSLHILGADENECPSLNEELMIRLYKELFQKFISVKIYDIAILFCGPNLTCLRGLNDAKIEFLYSNVLNVTIYASPTNYHCIDNSSLFASHPQHSRPSLVVLYNPGIWGYISWLDTLSALHINHKRSSSNGSSSSSSSSSSTVFLLTSYTIEEAEEDFDAIVSHYEKSGISSNILHHSGKGTSEKTPSSDIDQKSNTNAPDPCGRDNSDTNSCSKEGNEEFNSSPQDSILWLWECEMNPFCTSRELTRLSKSKGVYRDSQIWSSFKFI